MELIGPNGIASALPANKITAAILEMDTSLFMSLTEPEFASALNGRDQWRCPDRQDRRDRCLCGRLECNPDGRRV